MMGYADPRGHIDFRQAIADMLNQERNMNITLDNLCISRGAKWPCILLHNVYWRRTTIFL
ncbi:hypothetical protein KUH03_10430 [Sphingobacterium sp. E70]|uniref:hypothetical protein n=1 Tax=Sphingobacterium sp. E70 TaxID=2853439 RepID=UPI00211D01F8|nr:hypothetical protein [Sphingobacterium sp. E70]ULT27142.1 hypothetical protein KUH03_10430 [Sphingobacterium sp. E70]